MIWEDVKAELLALARVLFGLAIAVASGAFLYLDFRAPAPHTSHIGIFASGVVLGLAIMWPSVVIGTAKQLLVVGQSALQLIITKKADPPGGAT